MSAAMLLSDKRPIRVLEGSVTQAQMFQVRGKFNPQVEGLATVKEADDALNISGIFEALKTRWIRTAQYAVYKKDPKEPLGEEVTFIEDGVRYKHLVPDVPVNFNGRDVSLRAVAGMGVYDSIGLLKIEQTDTDLYTVSAVDPATLAGRVRAVDFMRNGWALTDEYGFPLASSQPVDPIDSAARFGMARFAYELGADGWHGSVTRGRVFSDSGWCVEVYASWSISSGVALVDRVAVQLGRPKLIDG